MNTPFIMYVLLLFLLFIDDHNPVVVDDSEWAARYVPEGCRDIDPFLGVGERKNICMIDQVADEPVFHMCPVLSMLVFIYMNQIQWLVQGKPHRKKSDSC
ncbi:hypothetical protein R0J90_12505, partial [Micrococcus sp. SIMBA_144]